MCELRNGGGLCVFSARLLCLKAGRKHVPGTIILVDTENHTWPGYLHLSPRPFPFSAPHQLSPSEVPRATPATATSALRTTGSFVSMTCLSRLIKTYHPPPTTGNAIDLGNVNTQNDP